MQKHSLLYKSMPIGVVITGTSGTGGIISALPHPGERSLSDPAQHENPPPTPLAKWHTSYHCNCTVQLGEVHSRALQPEQCNITYIQGGRLAEGRIELLIGHRVRRGGGRKGCITGDGGNSCGEWIKLLPAMQLLHQKVR